MTYCLAISVNDGIVYCSDSRTNAGVDQISTYSKMFRFGSEGSNQFCILTAGNLATTQAVLAQVKEDIKRGTHPNLMTVDSIQHAADYLGEVSREQQKKFGGGPNFQASFIVGGQVWGSKPEIMLVYPEGNHITTSKDTPYLQIGESKYGKPILDRILTPATALDTCALCALVSMDSTLRSNLTVGPPIEVLLYHRDSFAMADYHRFESDSDFLRETARSWDEKLKEAFRQMPPIAWASNWDRPKNDENASNEPRN